MLQFLNQIGNQISSIFNDVQIGMHHTNSSRQKNHIFSSIPFSSSLPYIAYSEEQGIFINENSCGFIIEAIPLVGMDAAAYKILHHIIQDVLEESCSLQCLLLADHRIDRFFNTWKDIRQKEEIFKLITKSRIDYFENKKGLCPRIFRFILSYSAPLEKGSTLADKREKIIQTLQSITYAFSWNPTHLLETVGSLVNFSFSHETENRKWNPYEKIANQLPTGGQIAIDKHGLYWNEDALLKTFRLVDAPDQWHPLSMQNLIGDVTRDSFRINHPFFIHYGIHCPKQDKAESLFWKKSSLIENQGKSSTLIRLCTELGDELRECDYVRRTIAQGDRFVWTSFTTGIWATSKEIEQASFSLKNLYKINHFRLEENTCIHLPIFLSALPLSWGEHAQDLKDLVPLKTTISAECPALLPIQGEWTGTHSSNGVLLCGRRGQIMCWSPFDNKSGNYNCIIVGGSGSGKSVFMQELLANGLSTGAHAYAIEIGRSFEKMCDLFEGQHVEFSRKSNICLNPFTFISLEDQDDRDTYFSFLKSIISCMAAPTQGTTDAENSYIEKAISCVWEEKKNETTMTDISAWLLNQKEETAKNLGIMLTPYTKDGSYSKYFEGKNNINFSNKFVVIELEELKNKPDLQTVVLQIFMMTIENKIYLGDRKTPFFICIDEAYDLLKAKQTGPFIGTLARRLRKYNGSLIIGTQSMEDFLTSPGAKAAAENSDWKCLLAQKEIKANPMNLSEARLAALKSISNTHEYREILICDNAENHSITRLFLDPFSRLLYSTQADEYAQIKEITKSGKTIAQAIQQILIKERM